MEPWDGPAAIAATDNEWVIVATDRNGLRPLRYTVTRDKLLFAGSETGMIDLNEKKIVSKGRLGPGEILGLRIEKGKVYSNDEIKNYLSKEYKHYNNQIIDLDKKLEAETEKVELEGQSLRNFQHCFGYSIEDLELILHPMAEDAKEATGSMGDDTPLAVLSDKYRPLYHYFRQNFSQVTNPPIDSLRENKVMSLKTRFGNLGNILDFSKLTKDNIYVLNSPILSNAQFEKFLKFFGNNNKVLDCTFSKDDDLDRYKNFLEEKINAFIHGPLAFDNAVSEEAATIKGIKNDVAGDADILLVPNLETGKSLSKIMVYFMKACAAGIVIGGKVPVVVPSRADTTHSKLASIMAAVVAANN